MVVLAFAFLSLLISAGVNWFLIRFLRRKGVLDVPNERSSHKIPTPRGGGIGIMLGVLIATLLLLLFPWSDYFIDNFFDTGTSDSLSNGFYLMMVVSFETGQLKSLLWIVLPAVAMAVVGWLDDYLGGLSSGLRFLLQAILASVVIWYFGPIPFFPFPEPANFPLELVLGWIVSLIWMVGVTNIYNFLDGINGFAGTQAVLAAGAWTYLTWGAPIALVSLFILAASIGFLLFNWNPAKIFMGDVGSAFLGFLFAALPFYLNVLTPESPGIASGPIPGYILFFPMGVFLWFFLSDGAFTMIRRTFKGEYFWTPHRSHLYQRLVISGWRHDQVVLLIIGLYIVLYGFYYAMLSSGADLANWATLILMLVMFLAYFGFVSWVERRKKGG